MDLSNAAWRTSSYSGGQCVQVAAVTGHQSDPARVYAIRDSRDPGGSVLAFRPRQWRLFTARVKAGQAGPD